MIAIKEDILSQLIEAQSYINNIKPYDVNLSVENSTNKVRAMNLIQDTINKLK